jgi:hypothetical protein
VGHKDKNNRNKKKHNRKMHRAHKMEGPGLPLQPDATEIVFVVVPHLPAGQGVSTLSGQ